MWKCRPSRSSLSERCARSIAIAASAGLNPNLVFGPPVEILGWVSGLTPGATRSRIRWRRAGGISALQPLELDEVVDHDVADAGVERHPQLGLALGVAVQVDLLGVEARVEREVQLAARGDVAGQALLGEEAQDRRRRERLGGEVDLEVVGALRRRRPGSAVRASAGRPRPRCRRACRTRGRARWRRSRRAAGRRRRRGSCPKARRGRRRSAWSPSAGRHDATPCAPFGLTHPSRPENLTAWHGRGSLRRGRAEPGVAASSSCTARTRARRATSTSPARAPAAAWRCWPSTRAATARAPARWTGARSTTSRGWPTCCASGPASTRSGCAARRWAATWRWSPPPRPARPRSSRSARRRRWASSVGVRAQAVRLRGGPRRGRRAAGRPRRDRGGARALDVPLLLLHAEGDEVVPVELSRALHAAAPASKLVVVPGGHHRSIQHDAELQGVAACGGMTLRAGRPGSALEGRSSSCTSRPSPRRPRGAYK